MEAETGFLWALYNAGHAEGLPDIGEDDAVTCGSVTAGKRRCIEATVICSLLHGVQV